MSGIFGSTVGCPLYMIKTQLQAQSHGSYAVGFQHGHKGTYDALRRVLRENGIKGLFMVINLLESFQQYFLVLGLWRGWHGILVRTAVGSSAQLTTFSKTKDLLLQYEFFAESIFFTAFGASMVSGLFTAVAMTPFDTVATRMFNQGWILYLKTLFPSLTNHQF